MSPCLMLMPPQRLGRSSELNVESLCCFSCCKVFKVSTWRKKIWIQMLCVSVPSVLQQKGTSTCYIFIILWCLCGCFSLTCAHGGQSGIFFFLPWKGLEITDISKNKNPCGKRMMHQHDSKQHFLKRLGYISHKC